MGDKSINQSDALNTVPDHVKVSHKSLLLFFVHIPKNCNYKDVNKN